MEQNSDLALFKYFDHSQVLDVLFATQLLEVSFFLNQSAATDSRWHANRGNLTCVQGNVQVTHFSECLLLICGFFTQLPSSYQRIERGESYLIWCC